MQRRSVSKGILILAFGMMLPYGCGPQPQTASRSLDQPIERARFDAQEVLELVDKASPNAEVKLPPGVTPEQARAAFDNLHKKLKVNDNNKLDADEEFKRGLKPEAARGLKKLSDSMTQKVQDGSIKIARGPDGQMRPEPADGRYQGNGQGHDERILHPVGNGYWSWSTNYSWWGVTVSLNHNYLYYLCRYTSWMIGAAGLPGWIESVLSFLACLPHSLDGGSDGARVYVTWVGAFWISG